MAAITPQNGRTTFLASWSPHTYWELNSTNLGTGYGDDPTGNDDNNAVASGDISTSDSYEGMNSQNDDGANGWFDLYTVTDACALLYIPAGLAHGTNYGLWHNGGGTNAQGAFLRATTTGVEIAACHNAGSSNLDCLIEEIPDADLPGWFAVGWQFSSEGGAQGDMGLWINGTKVRNGTRTYQLAYGSGDPDFGNNGGREPTAASCLDPSSYGGGNWGANTAINGTGILIANFCCDNPGQTNSSPAGNGDTFYTDYADAHIAQSSDDLLADDVESDSELTTPAIGQIHGILANDVESTSELTSPAVGQAHTLLADDEESASEVSSPALAEIHGLLADDAESASEITVPVIGQVHGILANSTESSSEVTAPSLGQEHALLADDVESTSEVTAPSLAEAGSTDNLLADDVESASEVTAPSIGQEHVLLADDAESTSSVSAPSIGQVHGLLASSVESISETTSPSLGQEHALLSVSVESASTVSLPTLNGSEIKSIKKLGAYGLMKKNPPIKNLGNFYL